MSETVVEMRVPTSLFEWLDGRAREADFPSAADYATVLLEKVASVMQEAEESANEAPIADDEELIAARLRALGYIG